jgi:hypothetical protein
MKSCDYGFALGKIGVLETKIVMPSLFEEISNLPLEEAFWRLKESFFLPHHFEAAAQFLEDIFKKEESALIDICQSLLKEEDAKDIFIQLDKPDELVKKLAEKEDSLKEFFKFYLDVLNVLAILRVKSYNLKKDFYSYKEGEFLVRSLEKGDFIGFTENIKKFYFEAKKIIESKEMYLLDFLKDKYVVKFLEEKKRELLGRDIVLWYYFAKGINLGISKFLIMGKFYNLRQEILKRAIDVVYS